MTSARTIRAPRGTKLNCKGWHQEAALRCLMNNLDPDVAERPDDLVVYGGAGKAARNWESFDAIVRSLQDLENDETLLVQSGKPVGIFRTHEYAPRVLIANSNLVGAWANWDHFHELERKGLMMYGQMTAGSWIYIGTQGIVQGTFETFASMADKHFGGNEPSRPSKCAASSPIRPRTTRRRRAWVSWSRPARLLPLARDAGRPHPRTGRRRVISGELAAGVVAQVAGAGRGRTTRGCPRPERPVDAAR